MDSLLLPIFVCCLFVIDSVHSITFQLHGNTQKCIGDRVHPKTLVTGEFDVTEFANQVIDFKVFDQDRRAFKTIDDVKGHGKFSFTASDVDSKYDICFFSRVSAGYSGMTHEVTLHTKHGVEAKSYEGLADAAKLKPLEVELKRLEDLSEAIVEDFAYMKSREEEMRDTNESTSTRVLYFSVFGMCCLLCLATWQVLYLRRYFKAKKLID